MNDNIDYQNKINLLHAISQVIASSAGIAEQMKYTLEACNKKIPEILDSIKAENSANG